MMDIATSHPTADNPLSWSPVGHVISEWTSGPVALSPSPTLCRLTRQSPLSGEEESVEERGRKSLPLCTYCAVRYVSSASLLYTIC